MKPSLKAFSEAFLVTFNAAEAYQRTHPKAKRNTCWTNGSATLRNPEVQSYLSQRLKTMTMEADEVLARLVMQARGDLTPFLKFEDGNVQLDVVSSEAQSMMTLIKKLQIKNRIVRSTIIETEGSKVMEQLVHQQVAIELYDAQTALILIGKHLRLFTKKSETALNLDIQGYEQMMAKVYGDGN